MDSSIMHTVPVNDDSMVLAVPEPAAAAMANLKILYQLGAALGSSFDVEQVLEVVMDLVFEHVKADRGIILLVDEKTERARPQGRPHARRGRRSQERHDDTDGADRDRRRQRRRRADKIHASRTIINHVINNGEGVLSSNAMADQRFSKGKSVHNLGIRSALCVPIKARKLDGKGGRRNPRRHLHRQLGQELHLLARPAPPAHRHRPAGGHGDPERQALPGRACRPSAWPPSAKPPPPCRTRSRTSSRPCAAGRTSSRWASRPTTSPQAAKGWRIVDRNLDKIYNLTMNLLAYSKPREPQLELVNPQDADRRVPRADRRRPPTKKA